MVNIAPKGLLKYISNQNEVFKIPKVPRSLSSKHTNAVNKVNFEASQKIGKSIVQAIVKDMISIVTSSKTLSKSESSENKNKIVYKIPNNCNIPRMEDCTMCKYCLDMKKFGGPGKLKQRCMLKINMPTLKRKRSSMEEGSLEYGNRPAKRRYA